MIKNLKKEIFPRIDIDYLLDIDRFINNLSEKNLERFIRSLEDMSKPLTNRNSSLSPTNKARKKEEDHERNKFMNNTSDVKNIHHNRNGSITLHNQAKVDQIQNQYNSIVHRLTVLLENFSTNGKRINNDTPNDEIVGNKLENYGSRTYENQFNDYFKKTSLNNQANRSQIHNRTRTDTNKLINRSSCATNTRNRINFEELDFLRLNNFSSVVSKTVPENEYQSRKKNLKQHSVSPLSGEKSRETFKTMNKTEKEDLNTNTSTNSNRQNMMFMRTEGNQIIQKSNMTDCKFSPRQAETSFEKLGRKFLMNSFCKEPTNLKPKKTELKKNGQRNPKTKLP